MFTGLIETVGTISGISRLEEVVLLEISAAGIAGYLKPGDSVAVSGACLTVVKRCGGGFTVDMMSETVRATKFSHLKIGSRVNLERALSLDSRLDGHLVAGHVDGVAEVAEIEVYGRTRKYIFTAGEEILRGIIAKGSVAVDGVSLTVIDAGKTGFSVGIIPTTLADTTISDLKRGDCVNIETDMIGKYVMKFLGPGLSSEKEAGDGTQRSLSWDKLAKYGWI